MAMEMSRAKLQSNERQNSSSRSTPHRSAMAQFSKKNNAPAHQPSSRAPSKSTSWQNPQKPKKPSPTCAASALHVPPIQIPKPYIPPSPPRKPNPSSSSSNCVPQTPLSDKKKAPPPPVTTPRTRLVFGPTVCLFCNKTYSRGFHWHEVFCSGPKPVRC